MFIEITDVYKKTTLFKINDLISILERNDKQFDVVIANNNYLLIDARAHQKIRNKLKESGLLI